MIYASDLDRTLIYSESFIESHPTNARLELADKAKMVNSYISKEVADNLKGLCENKDIIFIPVTTRSVAEYNRVILPVDVEWAITSSGGKILHNGEPLKEWEEYINQRINIEEMEDIRQSINNLHSIYYDSKIIDNSFIFSKTNIRELAKKELAELNKEYTHYKFYIDKNKVYAIPDCFGKDITLLWLKQYLNEKVIIASGDSAFDLPMIKAANIGIMPSHRYTKNIESQNVKFIEVDGGVLSPLKTIEFIRNYRLTGEV